MECIAIVLGLAILFGIAKLLENGFRDACVPELPTRPVWPYYDLHSIWHVEWAQSAGLIVEISNKGYRPGLGQYWQRTELPHTERAAWQLRFDQPGFMARARVAP